MANQPGEQGLRTLVLHHDIVIASDLGETIRALGIGPVDIRHGLADGDISPGYDLAVLGTPAMEGEAGPTAEELCRLARGVIVLEGSYTDDPALGEGRLVLTMPFRSEDVEPMVLLALTGR